jgi:hypothetical protein
MKNVPNENILKLRELTDRLNKEMPSDNYKDIVKQLKNIVDSGKEELESSKTPQSKIKCYETMCVTITNLLSSVNIK